MNLRHEWKHEISPADLTVLRQRLRAAARPDGHGRDGVYQIRSLYFDTPEDRVLREKLDGLEYAAFESQEVQGILQRIGGEPWENVKSCFGGIQACSGGRIS